MAGMLEGKVALVTGGGGIGRVTALGCAREGAKVAVADFDAAAARATVGQIEAAGGPAITLTGDVPRARDVRAIGAGHGDRIRKARLRLQQRRHRRVSGTFHITLTMRRFMCASDRGFYRMAAHCPLKLWNL
jgi:NAD(P)-dependent dehydrogenase (short-subunit alcohol dehydrogenase family)